MTSPGTIQHGSQRTDGAAASDPASCSSCYPACSLFLSHWLPPCAPETPHDWLAWRRPGLCLFRPVAISLGLLDPALWSLWFLLLPGDTEQANCSTGIRRGCTCSLSCLWGNLTPQPAEDKEVAQPLALGPLSEATGRVLTTARGLTRFG